MVETAQPSADAVACVVLLAEMCRVGGEEEVRLYCKSREAEGSSKSRSSCWVPLTTTSLVLSLSGRVGDRSAITLCCDFERYGGYESFSVFPLTPGFPQPSTKKRKERNPGEDVQGRECKTNSNTYKENAKHENIIHGGCSILPLELRI